MDSESDFEDDFPALVQLISDDLVSKYHVQFNFDKNISKSILEEVLAREKLKFSCICGGFFTKKDRQITEPDIYIYTDSNYVPTESFLNMFLSEKFRSTPFKELGTVAPQAVLAIKSIQLANGKQANVHFTYVNFPRSPNHRIQLVNTYDLECCKVIYTYIKNDFECSDWFLNGGSLISQNRIPTHEFLEKYRQKGFQFENNYFKPRSNIVLRINEL